MTYVNYLSTKEQIPTELYATLLKMLSPFTPHLAEEMWARLGNTTLVVAESWPIGNKSLTEDTNVTLAVQVCGKVRGTISVAKNTPKEEIEKIALEVENVKKQLEGKEIKKIIVVPNKIINIVA